MVYHVCLPLHVSLVPEAYLAVDFFFLLSGFVIAHAYEHRLRGSLRLAGFLKLRVIRLYPLFALGMTMGVAVSGAKLLLGGAKLGFADFAGAVIMGFLLVPFGKLPYNTQNFAFPFNGPAWSLFFEAAINILYGSLIFRASNRLLMVAGLAAAGSLEFLLLRHGSVDMGGGLDTFAGGAARVGFSFIAGVALFRLKEGGRLPRCRFGGPLGALLLTAVLAMPGLKLPRAFIDSVAVGIIFPVILAISVGQGMTGAGRRVALFVGALSYPMYITHFPIMRVFQFVAERSVLSGRALSALIFIELVTIVAFSYLALRMDNRIQAGLRRVAPKSRG